MSSDEDDFLYDEDYDDSMFDDELDEDELLEESAALLRMADRSGTLFMSNYRVSAGGLPPSARWHFAVFVFAIENFLPSA